MSFFVQGQHNDAVECALCGERPFPIGPDNHQHPFNACPLSGRVLSRANMKALGGQVTGAYTTDAGMTPASAEPVAWRMSWGVQKSGRKPLYMDADPLYAHPHAPVTVEAAAQVLLDNVTREGSMGLVYAAFDDAGCEWDEVDEALRALSGEKS